MMSELTFFLFLEIISGPDAKKKMGKFLKVKQNFDVIINGI